MERLIFEMACVLVNNNSGLIHRGPISGGGGLYFKVYSTVYYYPTFHISWSWPGVDGVYRESLNFGYHQT